MTVHRRTRAAENILSVINVTLVGAENATASETETPEAQRCNARDKHDSLQAAATA